MDVGTARLDALQELRYPLIALRCERILLGDDFLVALLLLDQFFLQPSFDFAAALMGNGFHAAPRVRVGFDPYCIGY